MYKNLPKWVKSLHNGTVKGKEDKARNCRNYLQTCMLTSGAFMTWLSIAGIGDII